MMPVLPDAPDSEGRVDLALIRRMSVRLSLTRSLYLSARFRGVFLVARGTRLKMGRGARVRFEKGAVLALGFAHFTPAPTSMHLGTGAELLLTGRVQIFRGTRVFVNDGGRLTIGGGSYVNDCSTITCFQDMQIGSGCAISWETNLLDGNIHEFVASGVARPRTAPVRIGDDVWIGAGATVLSGVTVGAGAVIGAGAVVTSDVPPGTLVAGNPARVVHDAVTWRQ